MLNQKIPTGKAFKDFMNLLHKCAPHFYDCFNDDDRKIIENYIPHRQIGKASLIFPYK